MLSKFFNEAPFDKGSGDPRVSYSVMSGLLTVMIAGTLMLYFTERQKEQQPRMSLRSNLISGTGGLINRLANYILTIALLSVPASVQYPMVTGGVMIFSTLACFVMKIKPSKRELISIAIAFIALVVLVLPALDIHLFAIRF